MENRIKAFLKLRDNVLFGYLFGSYARGDETSRSDVDIALFLRNTSLEKRLRIHHDLEVLLRKDVDMVVLNDVKNIYLLEKILKEGILLKDHSDRPLFEVEKNLEILDFKNFQRYIHAA